MARENRSKLCRALAAASAALLSIFATLGTSVPVGGTDTSAPPAAALAPSAWEDEARQTILEREYQATDAGRGLQAPNRAHGLRTFFEPSGARVVGREDSAELARLRTVAVSGRAVGAGQVVAEGARVEVRRPGLVEWFVNSERGLEQGWTVVERPGGPRASGPHAGGTPAVPGLAIEVAFEAEVRMDGDRAIVGGLEYGGLAAWDARGTTLPARMEAAGDDRLRIVVDDEGAEYPITVDPTLTSPPYATRAPDQDSANMGESVAGAGDVNGDGYADVIVGAPFYGADVGAAFVFRGGPAGVADGSPATAAATLESTIVNTLFGSSVAGAGDVNGDGYADVIVGANAYDAGQTDEGAAFVFHGGPGGVQNGTSATAAALLQSNQADALMGFSVAGAGDVNGDGYADVVVGAPFYDGSFGNEGAAFVFLGSQFGISATPSTTLSGGQFNSFFGRSVAGAGDVNADGYADVVVGAPELAFDQSLEGGAFVYLGGPSGIPSGPAGSASARLQGDQTGSAFGTSVAGAGDVNGDGYGDVVVGAEQYAVGQSNEGAAALFLGGPAGVADGGLTTAAAFLQSNQPNARFGRAVAGVGDTNGDGYDDLLAGASTYDAGEVDEGAVFLYQGGPYGLAGYPLPAATLQSDQTAAGFEISVAGAGDVNGDGYDDVVVGFQNYDAGQENEGAAFVFLGSASGVKSAGAALGATFLQSDQEGARLGYSVAGAGDVNGDGYDDVIVGAYQYDAGQEDEGAAFVFLGSASGVADGSPATAAAQLESDQEHATLGLSVNGAGDTNGDGYDDVVIGAFTYDAGQTDEGAAFVFLGSAAGVADGSPATAAAQLESDQNAALMGYSVSGAGDVDGDGFDDVLVGAVQYTNDGQFAEGAAFVFLGSAAGVADGTAQTAAVTMAPGGQLSRVGYSVAGAGDTNGDGRDDVVVAAAGLFDGQEGEGTALVFMPGAQCFGRCSSESVGVYAPATGAWLLRQRNSSGPAQTLFTYGAGGSGLVAISGDWDGDGVDTPGLYDPGTGAFFLRNANAAGPADVVFTFGAGGRVFVPVAGDWDGDGDDTVGLYHPASGAFFLTNTNASGPADVVFTFGPGGLGWQPIAGDWDGDGDTTVGLYDRVEGVFYLRNENAPGGADLVFGYGPVTFNWVPIAGDYDGDGTDTIGLYSPSNGMFFLRNSNTPGPADTVFSYGAPNMVPLVGDWNGLVLRPGV